MTGQAAFFVGKVPVYGDLVLSPMQGFSDQPYRSLARQFGSAMSYTEFINTLDVLQDNPLLAQKVQFTEEERPVVFQIFDSEPGRLLEAAQKLEKYRPDIIDINMGCSVRRVSGRGAGAGLLRTPIKVETIFKTLSQELDIPVSAKIRLGWDFDSKNYVLIARIVEENGGAMLAVHGRTRAQAYSGTADWDAIAEIKQAVSIPVIANGDVRTVKDIDAIQAHTACDAVMIGRAAIGNPWIFSRLDRSDVSVEMVRQVVKDHLARMLAFYGESLGLILFRKHASQYLKLLPLDADQKRSALTCTQPEVFLHYLE